MGFYQDIKNRYGIHTTTLMKQWANMNRRLAKNVNRRNFLLRCRSTKLVPRHTNDGMKSIQCLLLAGNNSNMINMIDRFVCNLSFKVLSLEIKITCDTISGTQRIIVSLQNQLRNLIPEHIFIQYHNKLQQNYDKLFKRIKQKNMDKFYKLFKKTPTNLGLFLNNESWFKNISNTIIPKEISNFLSLGPKFSVPTQRRDFKVAHFLADVENIIDQTPNDERDILRARTANIVTNYLQCTKNNKLPYLNSLFNKTKKFLKDHPEIYVLPADKGGCTVVMDKAEYMNKTETLLRDTSTYIQLNRDPTTTVQTRFNLLIKSLKQNGEISEQDAKKLTIYNSTFPRLYCLPKIHKPDNPLRPIVSSVNATTYELSKYLSDILSTSLGNTTDYNIKDTFSFVNAINGMQLPTDYVLLSLDVISLFTNIPLELVVEILGNKWELIKVHTSLSKNNFLKLITFIFQHTYFGFNNKFYSQIFGTPMGSPISPILATIVLDHLLNCVLPKLPFRIPFIYKYVDDIICSVPVNCTQMILDNCNSFHNKLQFTIEVEKDYSVPFLDTKVIRNTDNKIILDWYQKPSASNRFINFFSNHPSNQKFNTVTAMKNRITHISDESFLHTNLKKLFKIFLNNGFPKHILKRIIYNSNIYDGPLDDNCPEPKYTKLQFIPELTNKIVTIFKKFPYLKIARYNGRSNWSLFSKVKQKIPLLYNNNIVYRMSCLDCNGVYIGQTSQWLKQRVTQHRSDCLVGKNSCAATNHHISTGHQLDFKHVKILEQESNYKKRLFLEMCHINKEKHSVNYKLDTNGLTNIYCNILNNLTSHN